MAQLKSTSVTGNLSVTGNILASKIIKLGGTEDEILLANGNTTTLGGLGAGTVTSVDMTVPTGLTVSGNPITSTGILAITYTDGYAIPTTAKQKNWDTAYGWGDHSQAGYQAGDEDLTAIAGLTETKGFLKKTAIGAWELEELSIPAAQIQSDWNQTDTTKLDFIKNKPTIGNGTLTMGIGGTGLSVSSTNTFTANQSTNTTITFTIDSSAEGNRAANQIVIAKADGTINSAKYTITKTDGIEKASWQYNDSTDCVELVWA